MKKCILLLISFIVPHLMGADPKAYFDSGKVLIAAHRGGYEKERQDRCVENSAANIVNAIVKGFEVFETDLRVTKDGVFVVVHDPEISLETNGKGAVEKQNWEELRLLKKRYRNRGKDRAIPGLVSEQRIATFEELLKGANQRIMLKVDLKDDAYLEFAEIMKIVEKHDMLEWTIFRVRYSQREFFSNYVKAGLPCSKNTLMFKVQSHIQIDEVASTFSPATIEVVMKGKSPLADELTAVKYAKGKGLLVEQHSGKTMQDWEKQIEAGTRMFHTAAPLKFQEFLEARSLDYK